MEYRVANVIESLKRLPKPDRPGEIRNVIMTTESWEIDHPRNPEPVDKAVEIVRVRAKAYGIGSSAWLDWVIEI